MQQNKRNIAPVFIWALKLLCVFLAVWFIYDKAFNSKENLDYLSNLMAASRGPNVAVLSITIFLLMFVNWYIESLKWRRMIAKIEIITPFRAFEAVLSGLTVSFFTPNRIGEYAGRVFHLGKSNRITATLITMLENSAQLVITIIFGCIGLVCYSTNYLFFPEWLYIVIWVFALVTPFICLLLYYNVSLMNGLLKKIKFFRKKHVNLDVFSMFSKWDLTSVLLLSAFRYFVFSLQFYLLLRLFGMYIPLLPGFYTIALSFFVITLIPTFAIAELGVRAGVTVYLFSKISYDHFPVINTSFSLWFINLVVPAIIGAFFILNFRLKRAKG